MCTTCSIIKVPVSHLPLTQHLPQLLGYVIDARRFLVENLDILSHNCFETYQSAMVWLPENSFIRKQFGGSGENNWSLVLGRRLAFFTEDGDKIAE